MTKRLTRRSGDAEAGAFIGFDSSDDSEMSQEEVRIFYLIQKYSINLNIF